MTRRKIGQSMQLILGAASACALVACAESAFYTPAQPAPTKDACEEATEYSRRAAAATEEKVKAALQKIADDKSRECAAKTSVSLAPGEPSSSAPATAAK